MTTNNSHEENSSTFKDIVSTKISRRGVFAGIGGLGAASLLASCGMGGGDSGSSGAALRWGNWPL